MRAELMCDDPFATTDPCFDTQRIELDAPAEEIPDAVYDPLAPVDGVCLESWAAMSAALERGVALDHLLRGVAIGRERWDRVAGEWQRRMRRDTTWVVSSVHARALAETNAETFAQPCVDPAVYEALLAVQADAIVLGVDLTSALAQRGYTVVAWVAAAVVMGRALSGPR